MEGLKAHCQCLLFVVRDNQTRDASKLFESSNRAETKGYALLPSSTLKHHPQLCQFFNENQIDVLGEQECPSIRTALERNLLEIVEIVIVNCFGGIFSKSHSSAVLRVSVTGGNEACVKELLGKNVIIYNTQFGSSNLLPAVDEQNIQIVENILSVRVDISCRSISGETLLHLAVRRDQEILVRSLLKYGADIDATRNDGSAPLHLAVLNRNLNIISLLLDKGACINAVKNDKSTSLLLAVEQGNTKVIKLLLKKNADIMLGKSVNYTPLHIAVQNGRTYIVSALLEQEIKLETVVIPTSVKDELLFLAVEKGCHVIVERLLECGAKVGAQNRFGKTALEQAVHNGCLKVVDSILNYYPDISVQMKDTLLFLAIERGCCKMIVRLLKCGTNVDAENQFGQTALEQAVRKGQLKVIECILNHRPDVSNKRNKDALFWAVLAIDKKYIKIVQVLLKYGLSVHVENVNDMNLLHGAVCNNHLEIVQKLLKLGANVNKVYTPSKFGSFRTTLLHEAVKQENEKIVELLLDAGAIANFKPRNTTPIYEAVKKCNLKIVKLLLSHGAEVNNNCGTVCLAAEKGCTEIFERIMQSSVHINSEDANLRMAMVSAATGNNPEIVEMLLKYGASCEARTESGKTALMIAAEEGSAAVIKVLVENGANIEARCSDGESTLMYAVGGGHVHAVEMLLKYGARIDVTNANGDSSLHFATEGDHEEIFQALLDYGFTYQHLLRRTGICKLFTKGIVDPIMFFAGGVFAMMAGMFNFNDLI